MKEALVLFSTFTGMEINSLKSGIVFAKTVTRLQELVKVLNIPKINFPLKYLGLTLTKGKLKYNDYSGLITLLEKTLTRWRAKGLSYASIIQLLNLVFLGKVNFWL